MLHKDFFWSCTFQQMLQWWGDKIIWDAVITETSGQSQQDIMKKFYIKTKIKALPAKNPEKAFLWKYISSNWNVWIFKAQVKPQTLGKKNILFPIFTENIYKVIFKFSFDISMLALE